MTGCRILHCLVLIVTSCVVAVEVDAEFSIVRNRRPVAQVLVSAPGAHAADLHAIDEAIDLLVDTVNRSTGTTIPVTDTIRSGRRRPTIRLILQRDTASTPPEQYEISTSKTDLTITSPSGQGIRNGIARLLDHIGFRFYAPSPKWHIVPRQRDLRADLNTVEAPKLRFRRIWYAYGVPGDDLRELSNNYRRWVIANRLSIDNTVQCGHSYGNIIGRNQEVFQQHPDYFALLEDGTRDTQQAINARKFCFSNPELVKLVCADRVALLKENLAKNPALTMVSVDPSDGPGTCHCANCESLGTTTDRVFSLANAVARSVREVHPDARVGLYAYSSHRLPPTIDIEPNVYVQVAMGFNRTPYKFTELIERWADKVTAIGLREYYGVEAWDWGLPGRMRGGDATYHRKWIPYYSARNLDAINAETNANWGGQTIGLYLAAKLMWSPMIETETSETQFYDQCFGDAAEPMRELYALFDTRPELRSHTIVQMYKHVLAAWELESDSEVRGRIQDLMAYLVYVAKFRQFELIRDQQGKRNDVYYQALKPLMNYAWRIRHRDVVHYYALARRLCNGLPLEDEREDFWFARKGSPPVWQYGDDYSDAEIVQQFYATLEALLDDDDPTISYSRLFEPLVAPGADSGPSRVAGQPVPEGVFPGEKVAHARLRGPATGFLFASGSETVKLGIKPTSREVAIKVSSTRDVLLEKVLDQSDAFTVVEIDLPAANEYRVEFRGDFELVVTDQTPFLVEASPAKPVFVDYSGPFYFFVPNQCQSIYADGDPRLSLDTSKATGERTDLTRNTRLPGKGYSTFKVPSDFSGRVWSTSQQTRGKVSLWNIPPLLSLHRNTLLRPREVPNANETRRIENRVP